MAYDKKFLLGMINNPDIPEDEKKMFREVIEEKEGADYFEKKVEVKEEVEVKKPTAKKKAPKKKKKVSEETLAKAKAAIKKRTGKTEEECEKIVGEYRKLRGKATKRKKKETERVSKLKKEGKVIKGTDEKTPAAAIDTTAKQVEDKIEKEVKKTERKAKKEVSKKDISSTKKKEQIAKKVSKKIATLTRNSITSTNKLISSTLSELKKVDKSEAKDYLLGLRAKIDTMLKKFDDGGMVQPYDIQEGLISVGNNASYAHGGSTQGYDDKLDESLGMRHRGSHKQSHKDRRDESKGMEKGLGRRAYQSVGTMDDNDAEDWERGWKMKEGGSTQGYDDRQDESLGMRRGRESSMKQSSKGRRDDSYGKWGKRGSEHRNITMEKGGRPHKEGEWVESGYEAQWHLAHGSPDDPTNMEGYWENYENITSEDIYPSSGEYENLEWHEATSDGEGYWDFRDEYKKGGKTDPNWGQKVEDSPDFDEGGFSREAAKRGLSTQQLFNRVMKNPHHYPEKMHDQAIYMQNFYKFKIT